MKIQYQVRAFRPKSLRIIEQANQIIAAYTAQGFTLTLRQLYYQFVSRDLIPNSQAEYDKLGSTINDARLAGLIDWDSIEDRTRNLKRLGTWDSPSQIIDAVANQYRRDLWKGQPRRVEVWIEKDALVGVIEPICDAYQIPYFSCRGYVSQSEMHSAAERIKERYDEEEIPTLILHLGDHDPSGIDMSRDIRDRLAGFYEGITEYDERYLSEDPDDFAIRPWQASNYVEVRRIALTMDQIRKLKPPPNPAKITDSRATDYIRKFGTSSWELDALEPAYISSLIQSHVEAEIDQESWAMQQSRMDRERSVLGKIAANFETIAEGL